MILEICVGVIALAFVILAIFLLFFIRDVRRTLKKADRVLTDIDHLTLDIKKKSEGLDFLFHPLYALHKRTPEPDTVAETIGWVAEAVRLFHRIKNEIKR